MTFTALILAAGKGTRMKSALPKVLHRIGAKPMLQHVIDASRSAGASQIIVVYGHGGDAVQQAVSGVDVFALQSEQLGTGHAVAAGIKAVNTEQTVVLYGDVPLISPQTITEMATARSAVLVADLANPTGYGRIVLKQKQILEIVEHKDADDQQRKIKTINTGIIAAKTEELRHWLENLSSDNAQNEYYLTDIVAMAANDAKPMQAIWTEDGNQGAGVNDRMQQAALERVYQLGLAQDLMRAGAELKDPARLDIYGELIVGRDVRIEANVQIKGKVVLGDGVIIESNCVLKDCSIAAHSVISAFSHIDGAIIGASAMIGPYARLRPGTELGQNTKIGNFVETKNIQMAAGSKANHLSYLGDAQIGSNTNIGAGTITCNYDGANKHQTIMGDAVFIGSNSAIVAPVVIGDGATVAAGSTITAEVPAKTLAVARTKQRNLPTWQRPKKTQKP